MRVSDTATKLLSEFHGALEITVGPANGLLSDLLSRLTDVECSTEELEEELRPISATDALLLLTATLHKGMAYSNEYMPFVQAEALASEFIASLGPNAQFASTSCVPDDATQTVGSRYFSVSTHTFESVLYGRGEHEASLLLAVDED